jgi:hypothetical protein
MAERRDLNGAQRELLKTVCIAVDEADDLRQMIEQEGAILFKHGQPAKPHPAVAVLQAHRRFIARSLGDLGLLRDPKEAKKPIGRPPGKMFPGVTSEMLGRKLPLP